MSKDPVLFISPLITFFVSRKNVINNLKFLKNTGDLLGWNSLAQVEEFVKSPVIDGYRNKCEFSVGLHPETQEVTVGFRLASYKKGSVAVVGAEDLPIVSNKVRKLYIDVEQMSRKCQILLNLIMCFFFVIFFPYDCLGFGNLFLAECIFPESFIFIWKFYFDTFFLPLDEASHEAL